MKLSELKQYVDMQLMRNPDRDLEVIIPIASPSIGPVAKVGVKFVSEGVDWDANSFFIVPNAPLVKKTQNEEAYDAARDLLWYIATKPSKKESYEVRCAKNVLRKIGVTEDKFTEYQKIFHADKIK